MRAVVSVMIMLVASAALAAPAPFPKPAKAAVGPFEVDFKPLDGAVTGPSGCTLHMRITDHEGKDRPVFTMTPVKDPDIKLMVWHLAVTPLEGVEWTADKSGEKLIIKSFFGKPPRSVNVTLKGLDKSFAPKVKRLPK